MLVSGRHVGVLCLFLFAARPAAADAVNLRYVAYWGGLHAADFALTMADLSQPDDAVTHNVFRLQTRGVLDWLARLRLTATAGGTVSPTAPFLTPTAYAIDYTSRRRDRLLEIDFSRTRALTRIVDRKQGGKVLSAAEDEDDFAEADLAPDQLVDVVDPLLGLTEALRRTRAYLAGTGPARFRLRGFDGKRRFDMDGEVLGTASRTVGDSRRDTYRLRLTTRTVAGFKKRHQVLWNDSAFDLYLSRDGRFVPLQIVSLGHGPVLTLVEECAAPCALPDAD